MKNIKLALVVTLAFAALFISFYNFFYLKNIENRVGVVEEKVVKKGNPDNEVEVEVTDADYIAERVYETFTGVLRKEAIPEELELGDYWYWLYFDEAYLLEENARGVPMEVEKLQVTSGSEETDGKHVEITGYLDWGYAESTVIYAEEIVVK